ncbi:hypothetical protein STEG23_031926, partial [Scotinomys teguina]
VNVVIIIIIAIILQFMGTEQARLFVYRNTDACPTLSHPTDTDACPILSHPTDTDACPILSHPTDTDTGRHCLLLTLNIKHVVLAISLKAKTENSPFAPTNSALFQHPFPQHLDFFSS